MRIIITPKDYIESFVDKKIKYLIVGYDEIFRTILPNELLKLKTLEDDNSCIIRVISIHIYDNLKSIFDDFKNSINLSEEQNSLKIFDENFPIIMLKIKLE